MKIPRIILTAMVMIGIFTLGMKTVIHFLGTASQTVQVTRMSSTTTSSLAYEQHRFYGESLHFDSTVHFTEYILQNMHTNMQYVFAHDSLNDEGIELSTLSAGVYQILFDSYPVEAYEFESQTWYTIMRNNEANEINLFSSDNLLYLQVNIVNELPENVYDIMIDPGHGGLDSGAVAYGLYESDEVLQFSQVLATYLTTEYGLKVKLTRETDSDPVGNDDYSLEKSPYYQDGRVEQTYQYQPKLLLSNHLNTTASGTASGFQIYSSFETTNTLALLLSDALQMAGLSPSLLDSEASMGAGTYKQVDYCEERIAHVTTCTQIYEDYFFIIRETGGISTFAQNIVNYNYNYVTVPNYGAQAFLLEYVFIDNYSDNLAWQTNWQLYAKNVGDAIATYLQIL
ncbi:MAG: N-acetylmuramoyl-L-alanine amidase family protein [Culicoidibacterales bacterium]